MSRNFTPAYEGDKGPKPLTWNPYKKDGTSKEEHERSEKKRLKDRHRRISGQLSKVQPDGLLHHHLQNIPGCTSAQGSVPSWGSNYTRESLSMNRQQPMLSFQQHLQPPSMFHGPGRNAISGQQATGNDIASYVVNAPWAAVSHDVVIPCLQQNQMYRYDEDVPPGTMMSEDTTKSNRNYNGEKKLVINDVC